MKEIIEKISREKSSHKGQNGKVLVIGGSEKFSGAPALSAQAALRTGADLVQVLTHEETKSVVAGFSENLIVDSYGEKFDEESLEKARELEEWADVTVIGPGLSEKEDGAVEKFVENSGKLVIDAEAIENSLNVSGKIFTPHSGEAEILREKFGSVENFATEKENTVVLKGEVDEIFTPEEKFENRTGNSGMTVGGTGDVLTGIIAALWSQELSREDSARLGVWLNGKAGEKSAEKFGNGLVATDLLENIAEILKEV